MSEKGRAVEPGFTLPWNTTRTMAEVWAADFDKHEAHHAASHNKVRIPPRKDHRPASRRAPYLPPKHRSGATLNGEPFSMLDLERGKP